MNSGLLIVKEMMEKLPNSEKKIAHYILEHPQDTVSMTVTELGKKSGTSSAAVIRMCKSLKLKGFQDLKLRIAGDLQRQQPVEERDINRNESIDSILQKVTTISQQTIQETADLLDVDQLRKAVEVILNSRNVHLYGVGASSIATYDAQQKFLRINRNAFVVSDLHMAATTIANGTAEDTLMAISFSGETNEVIKSLQIAKDSGMKTISLTKYGDSTVARLADINLFTSATKEANFRSGATSSRLAQLHVIDILFMCVASKTFDETIEYLDSTRQVIRSLYE